MTLLITILLVLLLLGVLPSWSYMSNYGYTPIIVIAFVLIVVLLSGIDK